MNNIDEIYSGNIGAIYSGADSVQPKNIEREDWRQEAAMHVWKVRHLFDPSRGGWANFCYEIIKKLAARHHQHHSYLCRKGITTSYDPQMERGLDLSEQLDRKIDLMAAIESLPEDKREIAMRLLAQYRITEIAAGDRRRNWDEKEEVFGLIRDYLFVDEA